MNNEYTMNMAYVYSVLSMPMNLQHSYPEGTPEHVLYIFRERRADGLYGCHAPQQCAEVNHELGESPLYNVVAAVCTRAVHQARRRVRGEF